MTSRVAALLALVAFAGAWLVGVWCHHAPRARLWNAAFAAGCGALAGAAIGFVLERIVLERMGERWDGGDGVLPEGAPAASAAAKASPTVPSNALQAAPKAAPPAELAETRR
ncbi:MAG: hypothetical protein JNL90_04210 [Planctomycetes bacterium]|nr:hypothetical protein [Planctomycetota bacterium]